MDTNMKKIPSGITKDFGDNSFQHPLHICGRNSPAELVFASKMSQLPCSSSV